MTDTDRVQLSEDKLERLMAQVRQVAYELHVYLGNGFLEKVYEAGIIHRLECAGIKVESQKILTVRDRDGYILGEYIADLVVEDELIVEIKSAKSLLNEHLAQTLNYLKITGKKYGLLINFGSYKFEVRRVVSTYAHASNVSEKS